MTIIDHENNNIICMFGGYSLMLQSLLQVVLEWVLGYLNTFKTEYLEH